MARGRQGTRWISTQDAAAEQPSTASAASAAASPPHAPLHHHSAVSDSTSWCHHRWVDRTDVLSKVFTNHIAGTRFSVCEQCKTILMEEPPRPKRKEE